MHPKKICADMARLGFSLVLDSGELYIESSREAPSHYTEYARSYKARLIKYLQGGYTDREHAVRQSNDKIIDFMLQQSRDKTTDMKLEQWLKNDARAYHLVTIWMQKLADNGWNSADEPIANYETPETDQMALELFERAVLFFKKVKG